MNDLLREAKRLHDLGFAIIWIHPKSKRPVGTAWTQGPRKPWDQLRSTYEFGFNVGVRTGTASRIIDAKGFLACIDVDIKDPKCRSTALAKLKELVGNKKLPEVRSGSGNGSRHLYCVTEKPFKMITIAKEEGWEICVYSDGRQMVLPPSVHPSGAYYQWKSFLKKSTDLVKLDLEPLDLVKKIIDKTLIGVLKAGVLEDFKIEPVEIQWLSISEKVKRGIIYGDGIEDRSAFLLPATSALVSSGLTRNEILTVLTDPRYFLSKCAYEHTGSNSRKRAALWLWTYTVKRVMEERDAVRAFKEAAVIEPVELNAEKIAEQTDEFGSERNWRQDLKRSDKKVLYQTLKNVDLILSNEIEGKVFIKDMFANREAYGMETPWGGKKGEFLKDIDLTLIKRWLSDSVHQFEPNNNLILEATNLIAHRHRVHPVREWLNSLKWDGVQRIDTWIKDLLNGKAEEPYLSEVSRIFLLAMVKRVFEPGCQWDYILVLEGDQGNFKSSTARALASSPWFMDNLPDLRDKDAMLNLQGKWLVELGELAGVKRADYNLVKDYLIRRSDTVRSPFHRLKEDIKRQSVFIGTVNEGQYLKDPTGNRRFWPVKVGVCDVKGLEKIREQLFAEAVAMYRLFNEDLKLSKEGNAQALSAQENRRVDDDETEMRESLLMFLENQKDKLKEDRFNFSKFKSRELFSGPNAPWGRWNDKSYALQTASQVLKNLKFERYRSMGQSYWKKVVADP